MKQTRRRRHLSPRATRAQLRQQIGRVRSTMQLFQINGCSNRSRSNRTCRASASCVTWLSKCEMRSVPWSGSREACRPLSARIDRRSASGNATARSPRPGRAAGPPYYWFPLLLARWSPFIPPLTLVIPRLFGRFNLPRLRATQYRSDESSAHIADFLQYPWRQGRKI